VIRQGTPSQIFTVSLPGLAILGMDSVDLMDSRDYHALFPTAAGLLGASDYPDVRLLRFS
jgi:hypothetical protein